MKKVVLLALVCFALMLSSQSTFAQESVKNRVGFFLAAASGDIDEIGLGGIAEFRVADKVSISPQLIFYFPEDRGGYDINFLEINGNVNYYFYNKDIFEFYGLAGLNFSRVSIDWDNGTGYDDDSNVEVGLNLGGGINFEVGKSFVPFSEIRLTVGEFDQFVISGGLKFNLGR